MRFHDHPGALAPGRADRKGTGGMALSDAAKLAGVSAITLLAGGLASKRTRRRRR